MHQLEWDKHCNIALIFNQQNNINKIIKGIIFFKFLTFLVEKMIWGKLSTHGVGGGVFLPGDGSCVCWLVHTGVLHQIPGVTEKGSEKMSYLSIKQLWCFQSEFIFSFLNIIDLLGILPFYVSVFLNLLSSKYSLEYIAKAAQIFRILRILRIFKLSRHITGLKTLGTTLKNSHR